MNYIPICRGKDNAGKWQYGYYCCVPTEIHRVEMRLPSIQDATNLYDFYIIENADRKTFGMSTGIKAKKSHRGESELDRMIFEGDVCYYNFSTEDFGLACTRFVVKYDETDAKFIFWDIDLRECCEMNGNSWADIFDIDCEIIGNIHDNPEMLEAVK